MTGADHYRLFVVDRNGPGARYETWLENTFARRNIEQQVQKWIFEPYYKDDVRVNVKLTTRIQVSVIGVETRISIPNVVSWRIQLDACGIFTK